jgi:Pro-kumamolisin, activation domain/Bacterial Ig-like domain (group 3)
MRTQRPSFPRITLLCILVLAFSALPSNAQTQTSTAPSIAPATQGNPTPARVTQPIDEQNPLVLPGSVHPLARPEYDQGPAADAQPLKRMLLLLRRSPEQDAVLLKLLDEQQDKSSPNYHAWLTPDQFGRQFGPADSDIQTLTGWLASQGFTQISVGPGRNLIEFSGNVAQVRQSFHTEIHRYAVHGEVHLANSSDPQIPAALSPIVAGFVSINDFPVHSHVHRLGSFQRVSATGEVRPLFNFPGCRSGTCYAVGPPDFAVIYNSAPLLNPANGNPKIDGTGQIIAIVGESNIDLQDVTDFRNIFGLPQNFTSSNILLNGPDPGINGSETESDLDVEWAGAVAPGATVDFVTSASTEATAGIFLSSTYIVDNNLASVMSESFGACEQRIGTLNQFHNALWQQAAAQGITVVVSAGDGGSAGCDNFNTQQTANRGLAVSGFASTPFNVSLGGTDFDQLGRESQFWSTTTSSTTPPVSPSALSYIPEVPWNDSCAQNGLNGCSSGNLLDIVAGSGGASTLYSKPAWQMGVPGVPNDNHRDLPDVSLFAGNGFDGSFYIICQRDVTGTSSCNLNSFGYTFQGVGGTSASAPAFAGIMALVNQATGSRQGNANYILYALAKKPGASCNANGAALPTSTCTFNDLTKGNNSVPCAGGSLNCSSKTATTNGVLVSPSNASTPAYTTTSGYDLATGLGSINAHNLVNNWNTVNRTSTSTTLNLNNSTAVNVPHGTTVPFSVSVTPTAVKGDVSVIADLGNGQTVGVDTLTLGGTGSASGTTTALPGGTYNVYAHYAGDGTNAPSDSTPPVSVTVTPEASKTLISIPIFDPSTFRETGNTPTSLVYGSPYIARIDVGNANAVLSFPQNPVCTPPSCSTGTITWTDSVNGGPAAPLDAGAFSLNSSGYAEDPPIQLSGGSHVLSASYSGDRSYNPSSSTYSLTVIPAPMSFSFQISGTVVSGVPFQVLVTGNAQTQSGSAPTGAITFMDGSTPLGSPISVQGSGGANGPGFFFFTTLTIPTGGAHSLSANYSGDSNYSPATYSYGSVLVLWQTTATITPSATNINYGQTVTVTVTVTSPGKTPAMTGTFSFYGSYTPIQSPVTPSLSTDSSGNQVLTATITTTPQNSEYIQVNYSGDSNFASVGAASPFISVFIPDFSIPDATITVTAGQPQTVTVNVTPLTTTPSPVTFNPLPPGWLPPGMSLSFNPSTANLNGSPVPVDLILTTPAPSGGPVTAASLSQDRNSIFPLSRLIWWTISLASAVATLFFLWTPASKLRCKLALFAATLFLLSFVLGCGGGGASIVTGGSGGPVATSVTLATSNAKVPSAGSFTLTATVTSTKNPTGTVDIWQGHPSQGIGVATSVPIVNGVASVNVTNYYAGPGIYEFWAQYNGDSNNLPSQTTVNVQEALTGTAYGNYMAQTGGLSHTARLTINLQ